MPDGTAPAAAVGRPAPAFAARDLNDRPVRLQDFRGRIVLLSFLCGCAECLALGRQQQALIAGRYGRRVAVLYVTDEPRPEGLRRAAGGLTPEHWLLSRDRTLQSQFQSLSRPRTWVIDADGVLRYTHSIGAAPAQIAGEAARTVASLVVAQATREAQVQGGARRSGGASAAAAGSPDPRVALRAAHQAMDDACGRRDAGAILAWTAPDYVEIDETGATFNRDEVGQRVAMSLAFPESYRSRTTIVAVKRRGARAEALIRRRREITAVNPLSPRMQTARIVTDELRREHWTRSAREWRLRQSLLLRMVTRVNGRVVNSVAASREPGSN